ncbi:MAG: polysaccharide deacetylase family protein [Lachnospiraceae bacterium]|jgi:polysaccharide deacetylase family sporulation protein PdaB|nr:polysaccharide deacetylase family sporulation protein PdaB [Lachnospiraceae bacterium A4]
MLGKSNDPNDSQTSGVLIQYLREISVYLQEINISKKTTILAAAVLVLAGLLGVHYREEGTILPTSSSVGGRELPIYCVQTEEPKIALTFDAAWGNDDTKKIMEILKKHDVKVTFFMTGGWVEAYPDDVKMILAEGHDLGNHSQNHKNMSQISDSEKENEIMSVHDKVKELTGYDMFLFRPPYGDYDSKLIHVARKCNYYAIQWDVDSLDWKDYGVESIIKTVTQNEHLGNGSIILCHNGAKYTAQALETLITTLKDAGYEFVPVSELIYRDHYHMDHEGRQIPENKKN